MPTNLVKAFISAASVRMPAEFMCLPRVIDRPMPKKITPNLGPLHPVDQILELVDRQPGLRNALFVHRLVLDESAQRGQDLEVLARPNLEEDVGGLGAGRLADVHQDHRPALAAMLGTNLPFWVRVYLVKCRGWHSAGLPPQ